MEIGYVSKHWTGPWARLLRAQRRGTGCRLTAAQVPRFGGAARSTVRRDRGPGIAGNDCWWSGAGVGGQIGRRICTLGPAAPRNVNRAFRKVNSGLHSVTDQWSTCGRPCRLPTVRGLIKGSPEAHPVLMSTLHLDQDSPGWGSASAITRYSASFSCSQSHMASQLSRFRVSKLFQ